MAVVKPFVVVVCPVCRATFCTNAGRRRTCGRQCSAVWAGATGLRKMCGAREERARASLCAACGRQFERRSAGQRFCCIRCRNDDRRVQNALEKTPAAPGGS